MDFREWFEEMYSSLEDYSFEGAHKITWNAAIKEVFELLKNQHLDIEIAEKIRSLYNEDI